MVVKTEKNPEEKASFLSYLTFWLAMLCLEIPVIVFI